MSRLTALVAALLVVAARTADGASILYATAASQNRIDAFCLADDGSLASSPVESVETATEPRRLVVRAGVLYVAGRDQVIAYRIGRRGFLTRIGATDPKAGMDIRDIAFDAAGTTMYVTQRGFDRIGAYPLGRDDPADPADDGAAGAPARDFTSCVQGPVLVNYLNLAVAGSLLYVSADGVPGRIDVHPIGTDGALPATRDGTCSAPCTDDPAMTCCSQDAATVCQEDAECDLCRSGPTAGARAPRTEPLSTRRRLQNPKSFLLVDDFIYVEERARRRIVAFQLQPDGTFCDIPKKVCAADPTIECSRTSDCEPDGGECVQLDPEPCAPFVQRKKCARNRAGSSKRKEQCAASVTDHVLQYEDIVRAGDTILGTQFFQGRVDSYRLKRETRLPGVCAAGCANADAACADDVDCAGCAPDTAEPCTRLRLKLPGRPTRATEKDVRMTPVRAAVGSRTLYVAAGEDDRIRAYRLRADGVLAASEPFSETGVRSGSFPNDVAVAVLLDGCG